MHCLHLIGSHRQFPIIIIIIITKVLTNHSIYKCCKVVTMRIIFCVASPATGKTFSGDYLDVVHGFNHVDGDFCMRNQHIPKCKEIMLKVMPAVQKAFLNERVPTEDMEPYFDDMVDRTLAAAAA